MQTGPILVVFASLFAALPAQGRGDRNRSRSAPELENFSYETRTFESKALGGEEASYGIFVPKGYADEANAETRYPLVIWLHGMFEDKNRFMSRGGAEVLDAMVGEGGIPPMLFVCAEGNRSSFWTNAVAKDQNYEDLVTVDLLAELQENWRVAPQRAQRAIMGVSMGGYGALKIALKHPELFGVVAVHSSAILTEDPDDLAEQFPWLRSRGGQLLASIFGEPVDVEKFKAENVLSLVKGIEIEKLAGLKIYFDAGTKDRYSFHLTNAILHEALDERKIGHTWRLVEGGGHSWGEGATQNALPHSLGFVAAQFAVGRAGKGLGGLFGAEGKDGEDGKKGDDAAGKKGEEQAGVTERRR